MKKKMNGSVFSIWDVLCAHPDETMLFPEWTAIRVRNCIEMQADFFRQKGVGPGEVVSILIENDPLFVIGVLSLLRIGARPLLIPHDTPFFEAERICKKSNCCRELVLETPEPLSFSLKERTIPGRRSEKKAGIILLTSGSTGSPKLVERSESSLLNEAYRYKNGEYVLPGDIVVIPLPLSHAYAAGWLMANLLVGACTELLRPTDLGMTVRQMAKGATVVILTPNLARVLALRSLPDNIDLSSFGKLRFAMVGAGSVDNRLDMSFKNRFGIRLARNYGSTETGALFAGLHPLPAGCVGSVLLGIKYRILDEHGQICIPGKYGILKISDHADRWYNTGDIAFIDESGRLTIAGRKTESIRRGDRWVSPLEIEEVLYRSSLVKDVHVRKIKSSHSGNDRIEARVVPIDFESFNREHLFSYATKHLAPYKLPGIIGVCKNIARFGHGKVKAQPIYRASDPHVLSAIARAYKRSELLFALYDSGVLAALDGQSSTDIIARKCGLFPDELEYVLELANNLGLVSRSSDDNSDTFDPNPFIILEQELSRSWVTREAIIDVLQHGIRNRNFEKTDISKNLIEKYNNAMHGIHTRFRTLLGFRILKPKPECRILEITSGTGRYIDLLLPKVNGSTGTLFHIGKMSADYPKTLVRLIDAGRVSVSKEYPEEIFDIVIVNNAIHGPSPEDNLDWLLNRIESDGSVLIDDIFIPEQGKDAEIGLDWFTHGGISLNTLPELEQRLYELGANVKVFNTGEDYLHKLILVRKENCTNG